MSVTFVPRLFHAALTASIRITRTPLPCCGGVLLEQCWTPNSGMKEVNSTKSNTTLGFHQTLICHSTTSNPRQQEEALHIRRKQNKSCSAIPVRVQHLPPPWSAFCCGEPLTHVRFKGWSVQPYHFSVGTCRHGGALSCAPCCM